VKRLLPFRRRPGVALLITLAVIAAMLALIGVLFAYLSEARRTSEYDSALIQADLLRVDLAGLIGKNLEKNASRETLQTLYSTPLILQPETASFTLTARCRPLLDRLPISWLALNPDGPRGKQAAIALKAFRALSVHAELRDPERLLELVQNALRGDVPFYGTEQYLQQKKGIINATTLARVVDEYRFSRDDPAAEKMEWERYFTFDAPAQTGRIRLEYATPELVALLFDIDPALVNEEYVPGKLNDFLPAVGKEEQRFAWLNAKGQVNAMHCEGTYLYRESHVAFGFDYRDGRIEHFGIQRN